MQRFIVSRARVDFRKCTSSKIAIDGGQIDYVRIFGNLEDFELKIIELSTTMEELLGEFSSDRNELGNINILKI